VEHISLEYNKEDIIALLDRNSLAVERAIIAIFKLQTSQEQSAESTLIQNGVGFGHCHAAYGSYMAKWIMSGKHLNGKHLEKARRMAKRYSRQLVEIANMRFQSQTPVV
jgi:hypothetical protein